MGKLAKSFRDLDVYQNGLQLVVEIHEFCKTLPKEERYSLADQMRWASRSACSNIAEAWRKRQGRGARTPRVNAKNLTTPVKRFCGISRGRHEYIEYFEDGAKDCAYGLEKCTSCKMLSLTSEE